MQSGPASHNNSLSAHCVAKQGNNAKGQAMEGQEMTTDSEPLDEDKTNQENKELTEEQLEEELKTLNDYIREVKEKLALKSQLMEENSNAANLRPDESFFSSKDSTLKKNTAFVKKLRSFTESQRDSIMKDVDCLNLTKYIGEVAGALVEAKLKMSDIGFMLQLCSLLHQRYAEFSSQFLDCWKKVLRSGKDEKVANPSKLRVDLRYFADLNTIGIFPESEGLRLLANQLQLLTANDREENNNVGILISFCRHCGDDWAGVIPQKMRLLSEKHDIPVPRSTFLPPEKQGKCRQLLKDYYTSVEKHVVRLYRELRRMEKANRRQMQTKGELAGERRDKCERLASVYQKLVTNATTLADLVDEMAPQVPTLEEGGESGAGDVDLFSVDKEFEYDGDTALFEDEDTRLFYESLSDLKEMLPGIFYKDSEQAVQSEKKDERPEDRIADEDLDVETVEKEMESEELLELENEKVQEAEEKKEDGACPVEESPPLPPEEGDDDINASMKLILDTFLTTLPNCVNRDLIDKAAMDFCMNLNTKHNRRKLVRCLFTVHRTRYDLLPFYARLIATLAPVMPDVPAEVAILLMSEFRWHVNKKDQINIESKLKTVRFIGELVKFNMFPKSDGLYVLKQLITHFTHHNIEMACSLLDTCGRFLYRSPESHHRTRVYLDVMIRKKTALHMDTRYSTMIENAYYYCNPPASSGLVNREPDLPPMHEYLRQLLYKELNRSTTDKVLKRVRKLDWDDPEFCEFAGRCFSAVWNVRYNNIDCVASLLAGLAVYHADLVTAVVENVLEDIRSGMEIMLPKYNQRRLSVVKYLGELYTYRIVDSSIIFKTLYLLITFGVSLDAETPSPLDPVDHLFRISLVCTLLEICGDFFYRGGSRKKLDVFLVYFQRYYWYKKSQKIWSPTPALTTAESSGHPSSNETGPPRASFPVTVEYHMLDTVSALRPQFKKVTTYEEAQAEVEKVEKEYKSRVDKLTARLKLHFVETTSGQSEGLASIAESSEDVGGGDDLSQGMSQISLEEEDSNSEAEAFHTEGSQKSDGDGDIYERTRLMSGASDQSQGRAGSEEGVEERGRSFQGRDRPRLIECPEDDEFKSLLERFTSESLQARANETVKPVPMGIELPPSSVKVDAPDTQNPNGLSQEGESVSGQSSVCGSGTVTFSLMTRRGNKSQFTALSVPRDVRFVSRYMETAAAEREEKSRMKRLVLDMHEQQQEQEEQEWGFLSNNDILLARQVPSNVNRERRVRYQHPRGAPDADAIFGTSQKR